MPGYPLLPAVATICLFLVLVKVLGGFVAPDLLPEVMPGYRNLPDYGSGG